MIAVFDLQKSNFDELYYFNIGFWLADLGDELAPQCHRCHLNLRLESLFPDGGDLVNRAGRVVGTEDSTATMSEFTRFLDDDVVPLLKACTSTDALRREFARGRFNAGMVMAVARRLLV